MTDPKYFLKATAPSPRTVAIASMAYGEPGAGPRRTPYVHALAEDALSRVMAQRVREEGNRPLLPNNNVCQPNWHNRETAVRMREREGATWADIARELGLAHGSTAMETYRRAKSSGL